MKHNPLHDKMFEFATVVGNIVGLETGDKITEEEAYKQIKALWKELKQVRKEVKRDTDGL